MNLDDHWYYATDSGHVGPVSAIAIQELLHKGTVTKSTLVWNSRLGQSWKPIRDIDLGLSKPPPLPRGSMGAGAKAARRLTPRCRSRSALF